MSLRAVFVAGAGTGIGKTYLTAALVRRLRDEGRPVLALKPLASGVPALDDPDFAASDTAILLEAQGLARTSETVDSCSPWRFAAPLSPDLAAAREGRRLHLDELVGWCRDRIAGGPPGTTVLIEGVGGLMSPVSDEATGLDWLKALGVPALLASGSYLGAISHALTGVETLHFHRIPLLGIAVCESLDAPTPPQTVAEAIARRVAAPVVCIPRGGDCPESLSALV